MQSNQSYLTEIRDTVKNNYRRFFALDQPKAGSEKIPQMPAFQIRLFIDKALQQKMVIEIQFNNGTPAMHGKMRRLSQKRYLLTDSHQKLSRILNIVEIQSIKRIDQP